MSHREKHAKLTLLFNFLHALLLVFCGLFLISVGPPARAQVEIAIRARPQIEIERVTRRSEKKIISGRVVDEFGQGLKGAVVKTENSAGDTTTNLRGEFEVSLAEHESLARLMVEESDVFIHASAEAQLGEHTHLSLTLPGSWDLSKESHTVPFDVRGQHPDHASVEVFRHESKIASASVQQGILKIPSTSLGDTGRDTLHFRLTYRGTTLSESTRSIFKIDPSVSLGAQATCESERCRIFVTLRRRNQPFANQSIIVQSEQTKRGRSNEQGQLYIDLGQPDDDTTVTVRYRSQIAGIRSQETKVVLVGKHQTPTWLAPFIALLVAIGVFGLASILSRRRTSTASTQSPYPVTKPTLFRTKQVDERTISLMVTNADSRCKFRLFQHDECIHIHHEVSSISAELSDGQWRLEVDHPDFAIFCCDILIPHHGEWRQRQLKLPSLRAAFRAELAPLFVKIFGESWPRRTLSELREELPEHDALIGKVEHYCYAETGPDRRAIATLRETTAIILSTQ